MKTLTTLLKKDFPTPLGTIHFGLNSESTTIKSIETKKYKNGQSEIILTSEHKIECVIFKIKLPLLNGEIVTDTSGCIWRIEKISDTTESLETFCLLNSEDNQTKYDIATGEHLDAIEAFNLEWVLTIGTEDGETLNSRAENDEWFPMRFRNKSVSYQSITTMKKNGFITEIPKLNKDEKIHIQYLVAYDKQDEKKVNSWLAVDESKRNLEKWIGINK